jgi:hypothetical protein
MKSSNRVAAIVTFAVFAASAAFGGCSNSSFGTGDSSNAPAAGPTGGGGITGSSGGGSSSGSSGAAVLPPEVKAENNYQSPVATGRIVWTANPTSGRVAYVDAVSFTVQTVQAGDGPTYLAAVPSTDPTSTSEAAIVINVRSHDATLMRHDSQTGTLSSTQFASTADANSWAMSPSGRWAIAWSNAALVPNADPIQSFQDTAVLDLTAAPGAGAFMVNVGYRPSQVVFSQDESRAFAVTQDGISVVDLTLPTPAATQNFTLSEPAAADASAPEASVPDAGSPPVDASVPDGALPDATPDGSPAAPASAASGTPDVSFTADGAYALVRRDGVAAITVVSLVDGALTEVVLPSAPTDLTVAPDGTFAVAVLRDSATVVVLPLPGITRDPTSFTTTVISGETVGRAIVAEDPTTHQTSVLLFTTVAPIGRLTVLTLQPSATFRTIVLHAPVLAVFPTPDGEYAVVLHNVTPAAGSSVKGAFSIVPVGRDLLARGLLPNLVSLTAPPIAVALAPTSDRALVTWSDNASIYGVDLAMMPSLQDVSFTLASPPTAVGIVAAAGPGGTGFVAQNNSDGRITFIDLSQASARTITGFELGARIVEGSGP